MSLCGFFFFVFSACCFESWPARANIISIITVSLVVVVADAAVVKQEICSPFGVVRLCNTI